MLTPFRRKRLNDQAAAVRSVRLPRDGMAAGVAEWKVATIKRNDIQGADRQQRRKEEGRHTREARAQRPW